MFRTINTALLIAGSFSTTAMAGAFGIDMGDKAKDLKVIKTWEREGKRTTYRVEPPIINPEFQYYFVLVDDTAGACGVIAFSDANQDEADGQKVVSSAYTIATGLAKKYGKGTPLTSDLKDHRPGSKDFAGQLYRDEKKIAVFWRFEPDSPGDLSRIMLSADADDATSTTLFISYHFKNSEGCMPG
ncbi:hypothetical protein ABI_11230 [Asticcacaulis biprosthecium C19]|uniref:Uncharacterized protein n=1 Tax=Asticcacaulis biprosthecium C19 TaxID=715226 RepID=F4QHE9_9CAUL|nr:hypothetical protein [Asticcacaulis biprosthecium]EGF92686.1 hypothetical protein ABI_11230 [Asticcacaulis biprosthecium C19]